MTTHGKADCLAARIAGMSREEMVDQLMQGAYRFKMDFSRELLESLSSEKLRHILMAARLHASAGQSS